MLSDYEILGITETDNVSTIKNAYHKRVKEIHPDLAATDDPLKNHLHKKIIESFGIKK